MLRPDRLTRVFAEKRFVWLIAAVMACSGDRGSVASYALGEDIELGIITVAVTQWEDVHRTSSPFRSLRPPTGEKPVAVFVQWSGLAEYADFDRRTFVEAFLSDRLTLVDADDFEYDPVSAMPRNLYQLSDQPSAGVAAAPDWVVIFWAWVDSRGYELHVENPDPADGDFDVAVVELP